MAKNKHLTKEDRCAISSYLDKNYSFKRIGDELGKDCTTISKEVHNHIVYRNTGAYGRPYNACLHRKSCDIRLLCTPCTARTKNSFCRFCKHCNSNCPEFKQEFCPRHKTAPYVCNGCHDKSLCTLEKHLSIASEAQSEYEEVLSESRSNSNISHKILINSKKLNQSLSEIPKINVYG